MKLFSKITAIAMSLLLCAGMATGESCSSGNELQPADRAALENAATAIFRAFVQGNDVAVQQSLGPSLAGQFPAVKAAMEQHKEGLAGAQPAVRNVYLLEARDMAAGAQRAEFFCGVFGATGHTASSVSFVIPGLPQGRYGLVLMDATGGKTPYTLSFVLQDAGGWKMAGFFPKARQLAGFDGQAYWEKAKQAKAAGQAHLAWFYYQAAWELIRPVPFIYSMQTDKLGEELQAARPADLPGDQPVTLAVGGKSYRVTNIEMVPFRGVLALVVQYVHPEFADKNKVFQDNLALINGLAAKSPEYKQAFGYIEARATGQGGEPFSSMLETSKIK